MYFLHRQDTCKFLEQEIYSTRFILQFNRQNGFLQQTVYKQNFRKKNKAGVCPPRQGVCSGSLVLDPYCFTGVNYQIALGVGFSVPSMFHPPTHL